MKAVLTLLVLLLLAGCTSPPVACTGPCIVTSIASIVGHKPGDPDP